MADKSVLLRVHLRNIAHYAEKCAAGEMDLANAYYAINHVMGILQEEVSYRARLAATANKVKVP
jgi:hypothetical protein